MGHLPYVVAVQGDDSRLHEMGDFRHLTHAKAAARLAVQGGAAQATVIEDDTLVVYSVDPSTLEGVVPID